MEIYQLYILLHDQFVQIIGAIFILVLLHNGLAMVGGYSIASLFRLDFKDKKCLAIETGIHNATLGLIVWANFFPMLGGVAEFAGGGIFLAVSSEACVGGHDPQGAGKNI